MKKDNFILENAIQQEIFIYFNNKYCLKIHNPRRIIFSVPNDTKDFLELKRKKNTGLLSGVSDLIIITEKASFFLEIKTETGVQSDSQKDFQQRVESLGYKYFVARSLEDFKTNVEWQIIG